MLSAHDTLLSWKLGGLYKPISYSSVSASALAATAVCITRPYISGLAVAGALGVAYVIKILKEEFKSSMALAGTATLNQIPLRLYFSQLTKLMENIFYKAAINAKIENYFRNKWINI